MTIDPLAQPLKINGVTIKNRLGKSATQENLANEHGVVTKEYIDQYTRISEGGVGLIITGHHYININGRSSKGMTGADNDIQIPQLKKMTDAVHKNKTTVFAQLNHTGLKAFYEKHVKKDIRGPSKVVWTPALTLDHIEHIIGDFGTSALRMKQAGFDGIELHGAHQYLIAQFLSKRSNKRRDRYGGSLKNRQQFVIDVVERIRNKVGNTFPVTIKLDSHSRSYASVPPLIVPLISIDEALDTARRLEDIGVDAIEVSCGFAATKGAVSYKLSLQSFFLANNDILKARVAGCLFTPVDWIFNHTLWFRPHHNLKNIQRFKETVDIPIFAGSCFRDPTTMRTVIQNKQADMICMARPLVYNPDFPKQVLSGSQQPSKCLNCNLCLVGLPSGKAMKCYYGKPPSFHEMKLWNTQVK
jgi:2,4-dienoyl-CoA reductase-like NADH-dependent reductase (Old Yellow Enzyme family)